MRLSASNYRLLPAYNVLKDQHRFYCGDPCSEVLKNYRTAYPPHQLVFDTDMGDPISSVLVQVCGDGTYDQDWVGSIMKSVVDINNDGIDEYVYTFEGGIGGGDIPTGVYYLKTTFPYGEVDTIDIFTETFCIADNVARCSNNWTLYWSHSCDDKGLGYYVSNFKNILELDDIFLFRDGELKITESRKDGFGVETIISSDIRPKWRMEIMGNAWMLDSLSFLDQYDTVTLTRSENNDVFILRNIEVTALGNTEDCEFPIKITFTKDVLVTNKCCDSVYEQAPTPGNCAGMSVMTSEDFSICEDTEIELTATIIGGAAPYVYIWSNGETGPTITVTPTETTTYIVTAVDAFGCVKQDEVTVTVVECVGDLVLEITADPESPVCAGTEIDLDLEVSGGSGTYTYLWSTGATTQDITVTPTVTTSYSVTVTDTISGDVETLSINIVVIPIPLVTIAANGCDLAVLMISECEGSTVYLWQYESAPDVWDPADGTNNGPTYEGSNGVNYRLKVTCDGCEGYSNEITVECTVPCTVEIDSLTYDPEEEELTVVYSWVEGSVPFFSGYLHISELVDPYTGSCLDQSYTDLVIVSISSGSATVVVPYPLNQDPTCIRVGVNINGSECFDIEYLVVDL